jgi:NitT/TauT family transport system substrate-binding protein
LFNPLFHVQVTHRVPGVKMLLDASAYFPKSAIVGGWATRADYFEKIAQSLLKSFAAGLAAASHRF